MAVQTRVLCVITAKNNVFCVTKNNEQDVYNNFCTVCWQKKGYVKNYEWICWKKLEAALSQLIKQTSEIYTAGKTTLSNCLRKIYVFLFTVPPCSIETNPQVSLWAAAASGAGAVTGEVWSRINTGSTGSECRCSYRVTVPLTTLTVSGNVCSCSIQNGCRYWTGMIQN